MNWEKVFEWYLRQAAKRPANSQAGASKNDPTPVVYLRPDLKDLKVAYNERGGLDLADVKPTGLLVRSRG